MADTENKKETTKVGLRFNKGKVDYTQLSPLAQELESRVFMFGACKYKKNNWKLGQPGPDGISKVIQQMHESLERHLNAYKKGEFFDPESKLPHMVHIVWNANRIVDFYYYGCNHGKDGKDLFHQPLLHELPPIPTKENFKEAFGFEPSKDE